MKRIITLLLVLCSFTGISQTKYNWLTQIKGSGFTGYTLPSFNGTAADTIKAASSGLYLKSIAGAPGFEFSPVTVTIDTVTEIATKYDLTLISGGSIDSVLMASKYDIRNMVEWGDTVSIVATKYDLTSYLTSVDTSDIANFYLKVRGLMTGVSPATYNPMTGAIGVDTSIVATAYDISTKLNVSDTASMLIPYVEFSDTLTTIATKTNVALKLAIADTSAMLTNYVNAVNAPLTKSGHTISIDTTSTVSIATAYDVSLKQDALVSGTNIKTINGTTLLGSGNLVTPQSLFVQFINTNVSSGNKYFGQNPVPNTGSAAQTKVYFHRNVIITGVDILFLSQTTAGTAEQIDLYVRVNNTTDYLVASVSISSITRYFTNMSMSVSLSSTDYFQMKIVYPTHATPPGGTTAGGNVYYELQ